jgi:hypothetical protein
MNRHRVDYDHPTPYRPRGPAGQTGTHNSGPLSRRHHRVKTHGRDWAARQLGPGDYVWRTPHHRYRLVDSRGTHELPDYVGSGFFSDDPLDRALSRLLVDQRRGRLEDPVPSSA